MGTAFDTRFHLARRLRSSSAEKCCLVAEILRSQSLTPVPQIYPLLELHFSDHFVLQRFYGYFIKMGFHSWFIRPSFCVLLLQQALVAGFWLFLYLLRRFNYPGQPLFLILSDVRSYLFYFIHLAWFRPISRRFDLFEIRCFYLESQIRVSTIHQFLCWF